MAEVALGLQVPIAWVKHEFSRAACRAGNRLYHGQCLIERRRRIVPEFDLDQSKVPSILALCRRPFA